jgi:hypothetical protein
MNVARPILALLVALSVAILPMAGAAGANVKSPEPASVTEDMPDCCPPMVSPCEKAMDDCGAMATCALKCLSLAGTLAAVVFPSASATLAISFTGNPLLSQTGSPPFRPPRT